MTRVKIMLTTMAAVLGIVTISAITISTSTEEAAMAAISGYKRPLPGDGSSGPGNNYSGLYYNEFHEKAFEIDLTKLPSAALLDIPEELYAGKVNFALDKVDIEGELRTYMLVCEILTNPGINPPDSDVDIRPYHLYGSWYNEIGYKKKDGIGFNPIFDKVELEGDNLKYLGAYSFDKIYRETTQTDALTPRMYAYISCEENPNVDAEQRAMRISPNEMRTGSFDTAHFTINNGSLSLTPEEKLPYYETFKENLVVDKAARPDPTYLPDAMYSYARKLRTNYEGRNNTTLNVSDLTDWVAYDAYYAENVSRQGDFKSDLYFLSSVYKNSSELRPHQLNVSAGYPSVENEYVNTMPMLYMEMIEQFGTLDIRDMGLFNGWLSVGTSVQKFFGTKFITPMYSAEIVSPDNLIDRLNEKDTKLFRKGEVRSTIAGAQKYAADKSISLYRTAELEWSMYYPLRCITNGKMIQAGVETMIEQVYAIQEREGTLLNYTWNEENDNGEYDESEEPPSDYETGTEWDDEGGNKGIHWVGLPGQMQDSYCLSVTALTRQARLTPDEFPSGTIKLGTPYSEIVKQGGTFPIRLGFNEKYLVSHKYWCGENDYTYNWFDCGSYHSRYGQHYAVDFNYRKYDSDKKEWQTGSPDILAFMDGKVVAKKSLTTGFGTQIILEHNINGKIVYTSYSHMAPGSTKHLKVGQVVSEGQRIGVMGTSGNSSGVHLHFALYRGNINERDQRATAYDILLIAGELNKR